MFEVYLWIDGDGFDADTFQQSVGSRLGGAVMTRKRMRDGIVEVSGKYWKSRVVQIDSGHPEDDLVKLLTQLRPALAQIPKAPTIRRMAEIVEELSDEHQPQGFFFAVDTIELLAEMNFSLDIDVVRRLA